MPQSTPAGLVATFDPKLAKRQIVLELHNCQRRALLKSAKWYPFPLLFITYLISIGHES